MHERLEVDTGVTVQKLNGGIITPWESLEEYRKKDRYYLHLAFDKKVEERASLWGTLQSMGKNGIQALRIVILAIFLKLRYGHTHAVLPFAHHLRFANYHLSVAKERLRQYVYGRNYQPPPAE